MTWDEAKHPRGQAGTPEGGRFVPVGAARDGAAATAQKDKNAAAAYRALMEATGAAQAAGLKKLSDAGLQQLTAYAYSSKTSDPDVVRARVKIANEMARRGMDVKKYGAKGGGITARKRAAAKTKPKARTASAGGAMSTEYPPIEWFRDPKLDGPTPVTVTADGRIYGHIATWDATHVGMPGRNVRPPRSRSDYAYFHSGGTIVADGGQPVEISVGKLTLDTGHASLAADAGEAASHYDDTGTIVATVCAGEDAHGIWYAGAVAPGVDDLRMHRLRASAISGDWRPINNHLELVAALCVNSGGFPIPRARVASAVDLVPVVAAGMVAPQPVEEPVVAAPAPPAPEKTGPPPKDDVAPAPEGAPQPGDMVSIGDTGLSGEVIEADEDGVHVEVVCAPDDLLPATPDDAIAASAVVRELRATVAAQGAELRGIRGERLLSGLPGAGS